VAQARDLHDLEGAERFVPKSRDLRKLRTASRECRGCNLWQGATQTVFGEGPRGARAVFVGEQPGDQEDRQGHPFVGPAGRMFNDALDRAGIDRDSVYVTNAVKHFKWKAERKRRIHDRASRWQVVACRPWLLAELRALDPRLVVVLGAVAASSLLGPNFRVTQHRGLIAQGPLGISVLATVHPASILRGPRDDRDARLHEFVDDLRAAARFLESDHAR
jgi:uracil-DNA glycosylase family protein